MIARAAAQQAKKRGSSFRQPELLRSDRPETAQKVPIKNSRKCQIKLWSVSVQ